MSRPDQATALVTGASKGIGAAIARALAEDGWAVAVNYRSDQAGADAVVKTIEEAGGRAVAIHGDVSNGTGEELVARAEQELGPVLALVNNAGVRADGLALQLDDDAWDSVIDTNLSAAFRMTRRALRGMIRARYGRVVNVASVVGPRANAGQSNYAAAKAGLIGMTKTIAAEVARRGVTVNAVAPGFVATDMTAATAERLGMTFEEFKTASAAQFPVGRVGEPEDVADAVSFFASPRAGYVSGQVLYVAGGPVD
jgi:3-oxoacyl-[acyl-carrier protein] reductase